MKIAKTRKSKLEVRAGGGRIRGAHRSRSLSVLSESISLSFLSRERSTVSLFFSLFISLIIDSFHLLVMDSGLKLNLFDWLVGWLVATGL